MDGHYFNAGASHQLEWWNNGSGEIEKKFHWGHIHGKHSNLEKYAIFSLSCRHFETYIY
jgi:hypothetical protein